MSAKPGAGEPLKLMAFQRRFIYGVMYHHESALTIARGNGKTTLTAALAAAAIAGPLVVPRGQTVVVAASLGQAKLAFGHTKWFLRDIFRQEPKLWRVIEHSHECCIENRETGAMMRAIGSDPRRTHGLAPVLVIADEPAQWPAHRGIRSPHRLDCTGHLGMRQGAQRLDRMPAAALLGHSVRPAAAIPYVVVVGWRGRTQKLQSHIQFQSGM